MTSDRVQLVRDSYTRLRDRRPRALERVMADDFAFSAPPDVGIDRATYFERCWPNAGALAAFEFVRLREAGDEVLVTYEADARRRHPLPQHGGLRLRRRPDRERRGLLRLGPRMIVVCLPVADRRRAHAFYRDALGLEAIGAPASDGVPEPLQFALATACG